MYIPSEKKNKHNKAKNPFFFAYVPGFNDNVLKMQTSGENNHHASLVGYMQIKCII